MKLFSECFWAAVSANVYVGDVWCLERHCDHRSPHWLSHCVLFFNEVHGILIGFHNLKIFCVCSSSALLLGPDLQSLHCAILFLFLTLYYDLLSGFLVYCSISHLFTLLFNQSQRYYLKEPNHKLFHWALLRYMKPIQVYYSTCMFNIIALWIVCQLKFIK
jgi:hypothetical protein